jgi:hypothetical protein
VVQADRFSKEVIDAKSGKPWRHKNPAHQRRVSHVGVSLFSTNLPVLDSPFCNLRGLAI